MGEESPTGERKRLSGMEAVVRVNVAVGDGGCSQSERGCWGWGLSVTHTGVPSSQSLTQVCPAVSHSHRCVQLSRYTGVSTVVLLGGPMSCQLNNLYWASHKGAHVDLSPSLATEQPLHLFLLFEE